jgi:hypothetical protein
MSATFVIEGLDDLIEAFRALPEQLVGEATHIIEASANRAVADMKANYPYRSGDLRDHVEQTDAITSALGVSVTIKNTSKEAWWFEYGTQARHTDIGANRGAMPAVPVFVPAMEQNRREMYDAFGDLLTRNGLEVTGDAAA